MSSLLNSSFKRKSFDSILDSYKLGAIYQQAIFRNHMPSKLMSFNHFIFNQPRDLVSGDFYWCGYYNDKLFIAVGDCTGHGLPGAILSIYGHLSLTSMLYNKNVYSPRLMLEGLDHSYSRGLNNYWNTSYRSEGVDITIVRYDMRTKELVYAGSNSYLYVKYLDEDLKRVTEDKLQIGGNMQHDFRGFSDMRIDYKKGMKLYMSTDGYSDQFGGEADKKLSQKRLIELLDNTAQLSMREQKLSLKHSFMSWKGESNQTDDVLLMGIEL